MSNESSSESTHRDNGDEHQLESINDHVDDDSEESNDEDDLWGSGDVHQLPVDGGYNNVDTSTSNSYNHNDPLSAEVDPGPVYYPSTDDAQKEPRTQPFYINDIFPNSHLDNFHNTAIQEHTSSSNPITAAPLKTALIDDFVKASEKMKKKYLTQRFMYEVNKRRVQDQLRKRFGKPRSKTSKDGRFVIFIMTVEAAYTLRRLFRIERCYRNELLQPLGNRVSQRVKIALFSMRRAHLFVGEVAFPCANSDDIAFMIPSGSCSDAFDGGRRSIHHYTKGCYSSPPSLSRTNGRQYSFTNYASQGALLIVNKGDTVYILDDKHEQSENGVEDPNICYWYLAFLPSKEHSGLLFRFETRWLPIKARFGWVPSACINVESPVSMQYSLTTLKFRLESPRVRIDPDGTCR